MNTTAADPSASPSADAMTYPAAPPLACDVILKGGITSGVLYPKLLCRLATTYSLRAVGGASAGAIAAAAAAAAEYGRTTGATGPRAGFAGLERLPDDITKPVGKNTVLFNLFQPQPATKGLYRAFTAGLGEAPGKRMWAVGRGLIAGFPLGAALGPIQGLAVIILGSIATGLGRPVSIVAGLLLLVLGTTTGVAVGVVQAARRAIPANGMGLCNGMPTKPGGTSTTSGPQALTPWLYDELQALAGIDDGKPITFGQLADAGISVRMMTTDLSYQQALAMPWDNSKNYCFKESDFRALFPGPVVDEMLLEPATLSPAPPPGYCAWPAPDHLPVIVATRMSLSFPILLSTIPLYCTDDPVLPNGELPRHRFSDGGICSNLPIHFFDSPLPTCPTFAVDLESFPPTVRQDPTNEYNNSYLPTDDLIAALRTPLSGPGETQGIGAIAGFLGSIFNTARNWVDASHLAVPGSRDRVVTIYHNAVEGGMNLNMPSEVITSLAQRGEGAGRRLVDWYAGDQPGVVDGPGWERHRWIRLRNSARGVAEWLTLFGDHWSSSAAGTPSYDELLARGVAPSQGMYPIPEGDLAVATSKLEAIRAAAAAVAAAPPDTFETDAPMPPQQLKLDPETAG